MTSHHIGSPSAMSQQPPLDPPDDECDHQWRFIRSSHDGYVILYRCAECGLEDCQ